MIAEIKKPLEEILQELMKECPYCKKENPIALINTDKVIGYIFNKHFIVLTENGTYCQRIYYCPMCGKIL